MQANVEQSPADIASFTAADWNNRQIIENPVALQLHGLLPTISEDKEDSRIEMTPSEIQMSGRDLYIVPGNKYVYEGLHFFKAKADLDVSSSSVPS